jgi:hypothetical protein
MKQDKQNQPKQQDQKKQAGQKEGQQNPGSQGTGQGPVQGEGDYEAARRYDEKMRDHVQHHDVEREARDAKPTSAGEEREREQAEEIGKRRAKEEDPLLDKPAEAGKGAAKPRR